MNIYYYHQLKNICLKLCPLEHHSLQLLIHPYSLEEIERMALERLGMARPDPSQIIYINVPPISHVVFNPDADILPRSTSFWEEMGTYLQGLINRVFGG